MQTTNHKTKQSGFTIIEVLIVLAIAGLILLIVFLAVPALQRNSRNTQARNEAASVLGGVNEFITNNNGKLPTASLSLTAGSDAAKIFSNVKLNTLTTVRVEAEAGTTVPSGTEAVVAIQAKCASATSTNDAAGRGNITAAGASRQFALIYLIESSTGQLLACTDS